MRCAVLIPAYNPDEILAEIVLELTGAGAPAVVIVDDGSLPERARLFGRLEKGKSVTLLRHRRNAGKGRALKTGLRHIHEAFPSLPGTVTMDADGQHRVADALKVAGRLEGGGRRIVLGARGPGEGVPLRSRIGNAFTRMLFTRVTGLRLSDTQSGLRGIPRELTAMLLDIEGEGYEYETAMLMVCAREKIPILEVPVETVYLDRNRSSHFRPLRDSAKILACIGRFRKEPPG